MSPPRLWVRRLTLTDFRNHGDAHLATDGRPVCLFGPNGAGKTNILEALTMLAPGRGLRAASLQDMARADGGAALGGERLWTIHARLIADGDELVLGIGAERGEIGAKRVARLDGHNASAAEFARAARITWLTPAMDRLFSGPAGDRRRFFDRLVMGRTPEHGAASAAYDRALRERQRLLGEGGADAGWLSALEREMALHGAAIAAARVDTLARLQDGIDARPDGAFPKAVLALEGVLEARFAAGENSAAVEEAFARSLAGARARDAAAGRALDGPHRSDLLTRHAAKNMAAEHCSTGEQKALLIGLVLAHARALAGDPGAGPAMILLDEAAAHLDAVRRAALFEELLSNPGQAWLTGTDESAFEAFGARAHYFEVRDGTVRMD